LREHCQGHRKGDFLAGAEICWLEEERVSFRLG
jgi:hypothetical protein